MYPDTQYFQTLSFFSEEYPTIQLFIDNAVAEPLEFVAAKEIFTVMCTTSWNKSPWQWEWILNNTKKEQFVADGYKITNGSNSTKLQTWLLKQIIIIQCVGSFTRESSSSRNVTVHVIGE